MKCECEINFDYLCSPDCSILNSQTFEIFFVQVWCLPYSVLNWR
jgi:hypothetical protein